jgi:Mn-dependent DtxR family transcriptional regulator
MDYKLTHAELIKFQTNRVLSVIKMATIKKGYVSTVDIREHLNIPTEQLVEIRDNLITEGIIEEYTP